MSSFKEIVTKAVIGKVKKTSTNDFEVNPTEKATTVLGCWVINHAFKGTMENDNMVIINGSFDVNVWYSFDDDHKTTVVTERFDYVDKLNIQLNDEIKDNKNPEIIIKCLKQPTVTNVKIDKDIIKLSIEKELGVEVVGDALVKISVEDDYDDYDEIIDDEEEKTIDNEINEDYLK